MTKLNQITSKDILDFFTFTGAFINEVCGQCQKGEFSYR
jgi:hypothetical protein